MGQPDPRWTDAPEFHWIPDQPFGVEIPDAANSNMPATVESVRKRLANIRPNADTAPAFDLRQTLQSQAKRWKNRVRAPHKETPARPEQPAVRQEPRFDFSSVLKPVAAEWAAGAERSATFFSQSAGRLTEFCRTAAHAVSRTGSAVWGRLAAIARASATALFAAGESIIATAPALAARAPSYLLTQLAVGGLQGIGLALLGASQTNSLFVSALTMVMLFVPLLLLAGFGRVPGTLLLSWTASAGLALAALGAYQYWRAPGAIPVAAIAMAAIFLFIGQVLVTAWARDGRPLASYSALHDSAWSLAIQGAICAICAAIAAVAAMALGNLLRQLYPGAHLVVPVAIPVAMTVAFASWCMSPSLLRRPVQGLLTVLTLALPVALLFAAAVALASPLLHWQPALVVDLALAAALLLGINASYGAGDDRARWRQSLEALAGLALLPLLVLGCFALHARVAQLGWTAPRIFAGAALGVLGAYAVAYLVAAMVSLGGGRWMQRMERANLVVAVAILALIAALASPLADPARLAAQSQRQRIDSAEVNPAAFDFSYLRRDGGRFGHDALVAMTALKSAPEVARGAYLALTAQPLAAPPTPTQIGANIAVRGGQGRLPASLLTRDWSKLAVPGVPPCLTTAALRCEAYFTDLDGDGRNEIVLVYGTDSHWWAGIMKEMPDGWTLAGTLASPCPGSLETLRAGRFTPVAPLPGWQDLLVGGERLVVALNRPAKSAGCSP